MTDKLLEAAFNEHIDLAKRMALELNKVRTERDRFKQMLLDLCNTAEGYQVEAGSLLAHSVKNIRKALEEDDE